MGTILFRWQVPLTGMVLPDLMWLKRNRRRAGELATKITEVRTTYPDAAIHLIAFSGGAGVAVFACEQLTAPPIETLILACPAMAPEYNLALALRSVRRCYAWVSRRDRMILGLGTTVFGTTDRLHTFAAGCVGFRLPAGLDGRDQLAYDRLEELHWSPELGTLGHHGGHTGWGSVAFLREHLLPMLRGQPLLRTKGVQPA
jgi:hypothetical protein